MTSTQFKRFFAGLAIVGFAVLFLSSCKKLEEGEGIPSYIKIDTIKLTTVAGQGSATHKIVDAWIFVDDQPLGTFELPCKIPALKAGLHKISVRPGIQLNGVAATRVPYPFYTFYEETVTLYQDSAITINPTVKYFQDTEFPYIEDFTSGGVSLIADPAYNDTTIIRLTSGPELLDGPCGFIHMPPGNIDSVLVYMNTAVALPKGGANVYLEMDYKTNYPMLIGMYANNPSSVVQEALYGVNEKEGWNKIYFNLTQFVSSQQSAQTYNLFFGIIKAPEDTTKDVKIYIDNIKLVY